MRRKTLSQLRCPACEGELRCDGLGDVEIGAGNLRCVRCKGAYPILAGVAILAEDVRDYLTSHALGISGLVSDQDIPEAYREDYLEAKTQCEAEQAPDDGESERVISLYLANHFLNAGRLGAEGSAAGGSQQEAWWKPLSGSASPVIDSLVREYWDHGPLDRITRWMAEPARRAGQEKPATIELGCGVGGLARRLEPHARSYLGVDSSFASVALGRHLLLGTPYARSIGIPNDLLEGPLSRNISRFLSKAALPPDANVDLVVGDLAAPPVASGAYDVVLALNTIDMIPEPTLLPEIQAKLLVPGGTSIQSCPYIWHEAVAAELREILPEGIRDSASAVEWLYQEAGLSITDRVDHLPWLFFKHARQLEIYSVHAFRAVKE